MNRTSGASSCDGPKVAAPRESQIVEQMMILDKNLSELEGWTGDLDRRLSGVLREEGLMPCGDCQEEQYLVPHADTIRNAHRRVSASVDRIRSILNRLEL